MAVWSPGMPWPSPTTGGAAPDTWGGYVRFWLQAAIAPGSPFTMGPHANDRLDAGNVLGGAAGARAAGSQLWVDLTCDALEVKIGGGAKGSQGIFSQADAATLTVELVDPEQKYDPLNPHSPYAFGGHSRLVPGTPVEAFAEVVDGGTGTWERFEMFTGTADSWGEDWTPNPTERRAVMVATDATKQFVAYNRPEQPPVGAGDTTTERIHRIVDFFGWPGTVVDPAGADAVTLQATTLAQSAWEMLNRTTDDELGFVYFTPAGALRWANRATWQTITPPAVTFGCPGVTAGAFDVLTDASPSNLDRQMKNSVYASRAGGTMQTALSQSSIDRYGRFDYKRTDLGVETDPLAGEWAAYVVTLYAYPQVTLGDVKAVPALSATSWQPWAALLGLELITDLVRNVWAPPDHPDNVIDATSRVVGFEHAITRDKWEVTLELIAASALMNSGQIFTMGPHANDRLDAGNVLGFTAIGGS